VVIVFDVDRKAPPPTGTFYLSETPKEFADFELLNLWWELLDNGETRGEAKVIATANGFSDRQRTLVTLVTRRRVFLITESESGNGFGYRFDGEFVHTKNIEALIEAGKPILQGVLTRTKNGKKVGESVVTLWLENHPGC
jgi:hypothetical protein